MYRIHKHRMTKKDSAFSLPILSIAILCLILLVSGTDLALSQVITNNGGAVVTVAGGTVIVTDAMENNSGSTFDNGGTLTTATITNAGTLQNNGTYEVSSSFTNTGTFTIGTSTFDFNGSGSQSIPAYNFYNLTSSSSGARTLPNGGTVGVAGTFTPGPNSYTVVGSTISYNGSGAQTVAAFDYNSLTLAIAGVKTFAAGTTRIADALTITGSASGDGVTNSTTIEYTGTSSQAIAAFTYYHLVLKNAGAKTIATGFNINGNLTLFSGSTTSINSGVSVQVLGAFTTAGSLNNNGHLLISN